MKIKLFLACATLLIATQAGAKERTVERPPFDVTNSTMYEIDKIVLSPSATEVYFTGYDTPGGEITIFPSAYLYADGEEYGLLSAEGIEPDQVVAADEAGKMPPFKLTFPPLDPSIRKVDFMNSNTENQFRIYGIELQSKKVTDRKAVPQEAARIAAIKNAKEELPQPLFKADTAILKGYICRGSASM